MGLQLAIEVGGTRVAGPDFLYLVHEVGPHDPDGRYARMAFDLELPLGMGQDTPIVDKRGRDPNVVLEWARTRECVIVRVDARVPCTVVLEGYTPWDWRGSWSVRDGALRGVASDGSVSLAVRSERAPDVVTASGAGGVVRRVVHEGDTLLFRIDVGVGGGEAQMPAPHPFEGLTGRLERAARRYDRERVETDGVWSGLAAAVTNNLHWMVCIQPETGRLYTPAGRRWIFPHFDGASQEWTIFEWDSFFNALELAVESPRLSRAAIDAVLATQYPNGCMPNWRGRYFGTPGRSQPPVGAFCLLRLYMRTRDRALLEDTFPHLQRWSDWWYSDERGSVRRDGNGNGLFEWGTDTELCDHSPAPWENEAEGRQLAAWESGQDDLPNWDASGWCDETGTARLDAVDLNSYLALDHECLAVMGDILGLEDVADRHRARRDALAERINGELWDDERGLYMDRHWDGRFSTRVASTNFLPLLAGVAPPERVRRMLDVLLDERRFWGDNVVPTISRDDPAFPDQQYWRGTIWPPTNYLLYHGLRRAERDHDASHLARRSVELFMASWRAHQLCGENYDSRTGAWGGRRYQSWGPLLALVGIEEFIDVTPWDGLRFGTLSPPGETTLKRVLAQGRTWSVSLSRAGLSVERDGRPLLQSDRPIVLRHVVERGGVLTASVTAEARCRIRSEVEEVRLAPGRRNIRLRVADGG